MKKCIVSSIHINVGLIKSMIKKNLQGKISRNMLYDFSSLNPAPDTILRDFNVKARYLHTGRVNFKTFEYANLRKYHNMCENVTRKLKK